MTASDQLLETIRAEALALGEVNQLARRMARTTLAVALVGSLALIVAAAISHVAAVALLEPPFLVLLLAVVFHDYSEVTVLGAARAQLEQQLTERLGAEVVLYERAVAPIRKHAPLVGSVRGLQSLFTLMALALLIGPFAVAAPNAPGWAIATSAAFSAAGLGVAVASYRDMLRTWDVAVGSLKSTAGPASPTNA